MSDYLLRTQNLSRDFKGFTAVDSVNLNVRRGHIHALIGPNGAGKTTCFNLLTKFLAPTSGRIFYNDLDITDAAPASVARMGVIRSFQVSAVFDHMTVRQNVRVGMQRKFGFSAQFWKPASVLGHLDDRVDDLLAKVNLQGFGNELAVNLSYGRKRALEIAATLAMEPELMLLDEPTQGMGHEDVGVIAQLIRSVAKGRTILMVEHNMRVVSQICDRISVLQRGALLAEGSYDEISRNPQVMEAYMGSAAVELQGAHA